VKVESGKKTVNEDVQSLNIEGKSTNNPQAIASAFEIMSFFFLARFRIIMPVPNCSNLHIHSFPNTHFPQGQKTFSFNILCGTQ
jgi:hypothetical protein